MMSAGQHSQYRPFWDTIKREKKLVLRVVPRYHRRVIKGIIKAKYLDNKARKEVGAPLIYDKLRVTKMEDNILVFTLQLVNNSLLEED